MHQTSTIQEIPRLFQVKKKNSYIFREINCLFTLFVYIISANFNGNPMFDTLKKIPNHLPDDATHLALTYNGLAWEISGLANKEKENASKHANCK